MHASAASPLDPSAPPLAVGLAPPLPPGASDGGDVLARIRFRPRPDPEGGATAGLWEVPLPLLGDAPVDEVWRGGRPVAAGRRGDFVWRSSGDALFGALRIGDDDIEQATAAAYAAVFEALAAIGRYRLVRIWNYFSRIHAAATGSDRYGLFCRGRHRTLAVRLADFERSLPAASAIGSAVPGLVLHVLATRDGGRQIENPRQVSAFHYPRAYAPRSPSFSRSVLTALPGGAGRLYVSGTASIVGHRTRHPGMLAPQLDETFDNLAALLAEAGDRAGAPFAFRLLRVYLRGDADPAPVRAALAARLGADCPAVVLAGAICREALLVEIEGIAETPALPPGA